MMIENEKIASPNQMKRNHTFLTGMYMAINAMQRAYLLMDGPDCAYKKVELFDRNHDFLSNMFSREGKHKISSTVTDVNHVIDERHDKIVDEILKISSVDDAQAVFLSSEPMVALTGVDYDMLASTAQKKTEKDIISIPYQSLDKDWLDGYSFVMESIAKHLELRSDKKKENTVAVVGFLFDRNEGDNIGNIDELHRVLGLLSLDVSSIWFSGSDFAGLKAIEEASYIIKMPYGGSAADIIAEKTGAEVITVGIPFGIRGTQDWIKTIAAKVGKEKDAEELIEQEMSSVMPLLEWIVPNYIQGKKVAFAGDPYIAKAFIDAMDDVDAEVSDVVLYSTVDRKISIDSVGVYYETDAVQDLRDIDLAVGHHDSRYIIGPQSREAFIEFGFPSHTTHFFSVEPYMGYKGFVLFLNRVINSILKTNHP